MLHRHSTHPLETAATIPALQTHSFLIPTASGLKTKFNFSVTLNPSHSRGSASYAFFQEYNTDTQKLFPHLHVTNITLHTHFSQTQLQKILVSRATLKQPLLRLLQEIWRSKQISSLPRDQITAHPDHYNNSLLNGSYELVFPIQGIRLKRKRNVLQYRGNRHLQRKTQVLLEPSILSAHSLGRLSFVIYLYYIHALLAIVAIKINFFGRCKPQTWGVGEVFQKNKHTPSPLA